MGPNKRSIKLNEECDPYSNDFDLLAWWKKHGGKLIVGAIPFFL